MTSSAYSSGWYPTTSSSSPSINIFIPYSSSYSRETHEMYNELGLILRPSKTITSPTTTSKSKSSLGSSFKLTKSRSYEMIRRFLRHYQLSGPSGRQVALPIDKPRVVLVWPYSPVWVRNVLHFEPPMHHLFRWNAHPKPNISKAAYLRTARLKIGTTFTTFISNYINSDLDFPWPYIHCSRNWTSPIFTFYIVLSENSTWLCALYG